MKLSNKNLLDFFNGTLSLKEKILPLKLSFAVKHNRNEAYRKLEAYEEMRVELVNRFQKEPARLDNEIAKLLKEEVEVDIKIVSVDAIMQTESDGNDKLTLGELEAISFMIEE